MKDGKCGTYGKCGTLLVVMQLMPLATPKHCLEQQGYPEGTQLLFPSLWVLP